jgi:hypothetical protein
MLLFLDIDGVLHPAISLGDDDGKLCRKSRFESIMRDYPEWMIVISSGWRHKFSLEKLRSFFSEDIAARIIGSTPIYQLSLPFHRQHEIEQYLQNAARKYVPWLALDDNVADFYPGSPNLVLCNAVVGIDHEVEVQLRAKLESLRANATGGEIAD